MLCVVIVCRNTVSQLGLQVCVERDEHRAELEGEKLLPAVLRNMITRRVSDIRDFELPPNDGVSTIVLGKHLCGLGTDCSIDFIVRQRSDVVGCVFATCCLNKICEDAKLFTELYSLGDDAADRSGGLGGDSDGGGGGGGGAGAGGDGGGDVNEGDCSPSAPATRKSEGDHPPATLPMPSAPVRLPVVALVHKLACLTSWRVTSRSESSVISPGMLRESEWVESVFSWFRKQKLERRFADVREIIYCQGDVHSLQNRCLVACNPNGVGSGSRGGEGEGDKEGTSACAYLTHSVGVADDNLDVTNNPKQTTIIEEPTPTLPPTLPPAPLASPSAAPSPHYADLVAEFYARIEAQITKHADILPIDMRPAYLPP